MPRHRAAILIVARDNPVGLWAQIEALVACDLPDDVEVVVVDDASGPETRSLLARLEGDVTIRRSDRPIGRRSALAAAAGEASADVCIALTTIARPKPGFIDPLLAALATGVTLAAPVIETAAGDVHGYRADPGGSLWPLAAGEAAPDVLALDCLAARKQWWIERHPLFTAREGHYEPLVAEAAGGRLAVAPAARIGRATEGPRASVIVCTRDRADEVADCIRACVAHGVTAGGCELIVVDNGAEPLALEPPAGVRVVREPAAGLSRARNAGAAAAASDILVYLDDDARPAPGWLESLRDAFIDPRTAVAGGPIHGLWPPERPRGWPPPGTESLFSVLSLGDADTTFPGHAEVYGANWAIRASVLEQVGGFDPDVGLQPGTRINGDEYTVAHRVARSGLGAGRYVAAAGVGHRVSPDRIDEGYMVTRGFTNGVEIVSYDEDLGPTAERRTAHLGQGSTALAGLALPSGDVEQALQAVYDLPLPVERRVQAAAALGRVTMAATALGVGEVTAGKSTFDIRSGDAHGLVRLPRRRPRRPGPPGERESVLFFYPDMPEPSRSAGHTRASEIAFALRRLGYRTTLACETSAGYEAATERFAGSGIEVAATDRGDDLDALLRRGFDAAIVSFYTLAARVVPVLRAVSPRTRVAVDSVDVHFVRMRRAAELAGDQIAVARADHGRAQELAVYAGADVVLAVTEDERTLLAGLLPGADVQVLGNVHRVAETVAPLHDRGGSLFVGSYGHAPNADAVRWLCSDVMPLLHAAGHANPVVVAGANMPDDLATLATAAGAQPRGFVPSMEDELAARRISIAPLRFGAGLKGKVGESLAAGVPVVGTTIAAEGFDRPGRGMLIADTAAAFAEAMMRLEADDALWATLSDGGRELVSETLGLGACEAALERILGSLLIRRAA
jgi:glycosyltransferase involved in cell wall biosynthesis